MPCLTCCWSCNNVHQFTSTLSRSTWIKSSLGFLPMCFPTISRRLEFLFVSRNGTPAQSSNDSSLKRQTVPVRSAPDSVVASSIASPQS